MADFVSSSDILNEASKFDGGQGFAANRPLYSGKNVQVGGYTEPETPPKFDVKQTYGTPAKLLDNTIQIESSGNPNAVNPQSDAVGVGQFIPSTIKMLNDQGVFFNPKDAKESRAAMDYYISHLAKKHKGDYTKAMSEYGGFKTKDPSKYLEKVLEGVDNTSHDPELISSEALKKEAESLNIPESELKEPEKLTAGRVAGLVTRGMAPTVTGATAGQLVAGPAGALVGSVALPVGDVLNTGVNAITGQINKYAGTNIPQLQMPSQVVSNYMTEAGLPVAQSTAERMIESAGSALGGTSSQLPAMFNLAKNATSPVVKAMAKQFAQSPTAQVLASPTAAAVSQGVTEKTNNPYLGALAGLVTAAPFGFSITRKAIGAPTQGTLEAEADILYDKVRASGIQLNKKDFYDEMSKIGPELRAQGYTPPPPGTTDPFPSVTHALRNLTDVTNPKDFTELSALRTMIKNAQASTNPVERRLGTILKEKFDDYVINVPDENVIAGDKKGLTAWKEAREVYTKLKKAEYFDDIVRNSEYEKNPTNYITNQIKSLAKNDKKMRLYTAQEQEAIRDLAKGNAGSKTLEVISRFAPTGPLSGMFALEALEKIPYVGKPLAFGSTIAKKVSEQNKIQNVANLADMMRLGYKPELESRFKNVPATALRGLLSGQPTPKGQ